MLDLVPIWKDRGINKDLKMKLVRSLVWTVLTYGTQGWTLREADEKRIQSAELSIYRRMLRVSWTEHTTDKSILTELGTTRQFLGFVVRRKLSFFGHTIRDGGCELVKCVIQGKVSGKRRHGRPKTSYSSNITKWTPESTKRITRETRDRSGWRRLIRCAARAADHHSWWDHERGDHLHIFVGPSSPSSSSAVRFQLCQLSFQFFSYFPDVVEPSPSTLPSSSLPRYNHVHHFSWELCCLLLFSRCVRTNLIFSVSGMLTFGTLWHPLVWPGFWHILSGLAPS